MNTIESITEYLTKQVKEGQPIGPHEWMDAASAINVLLQTEQENLFLLEQKIARTRATLIESGKTVAYARTVIEATDEYVEARKQKAKIDRAIELIKISKVNSRIARDLMSGQL